MGIRPCSRYRLPVTVSTSADVLSLVRRALDEFDDRPLDATVRRVARIALLLGETELSVRLGLELTPTGGLPAANRADTQRLMADSSSWGDPDGPAERAFQAYAGRRQIKNGEEKLAAHSLAEIMCWLGRYDNERFGNASESAFHMRTILESVRHTAFAALCSWERQLTYADVNERIFERFRSQVDASLAKGAPEVLDQFSAVYRRLREVVRTPEASIQEDLAQAVTTCRRILKAVADHVLPGVRGATNDNGVSLDDAAYRNRIHEFVAQNVSSTSVAESAKAAYGGLIDRFNALDKLANKGVHAQLGLHEAELCAINTYLVTGELLAIAARSTTDAANS